MKKAQNLSINTIIMAVIALVVLVVIIFIFTDYWSQTDFNDCTTKNGECLYSCSDKQGYIPLNGNCPEEGPSGFSDGETA